MRNDITIRPERPEYYPVIDALVRRSFTEGTNYSDGSDIVALIDEIRKGPYYLPELSFVAELNGQIVGHFLFSEFPLSETPEGGFHDVKEEKVIMLAPVSVHADHFHQHIGVTMLRMGLEKVREAGYRGVNVEGDYHFYNRVGFRTSAEFDIYPTEGIPMTEPRCMMCQEMVPGALDKIHGYVVYEGIYENA